MKKIIFDLYNCQENILDNEIKLYDILVEMADQLHLKMILRPTIVPYYYGKNPKDDGASLCFFYEYNNQIGFCSLHSFEKRKIVYFDFYNVTDEELNFKIQSFLIHKFNPGQFNPPLPTNSKSWGKQVEFHADINKPSLENIIDMIYEIVDKIDMTIINNPIITKNKKETSLVLLIAESHIFVKYSKSKLCINIFSCKDFNVKKIENILKKMNVKNLSCSNVEARGVKHLKTKIDDFTINDIVEIKSQLLCYGLAIDEKCINKIIKEKPYFADKGFVHAVNINILGHNTCVSTAEKFSKHSNFILNWNESEKEYFISNEKYKYVPIHIFDDLPMTNSVIDQIAKPHSLTCISMWPSLKCCFANNESKKCKFCSIENNEYDIIDVLDVVKGIKKLFKKTHEYSLNIGGGTYKNPDIMIDYLCEINKGIRKFSDTAISNEIAPPKNLYQLEKLKQSGCNSVIINLEIANDSLRAIVCPAKHEISYEHYYKTYKKAVEVFGRGKVSCVLIVGLQKNEDIVKECEKLVSIGVVPTLIPFKSMDNCEYRDKENCNPKDLINCAKKLSEILKKYGLSPCNQLGCTKCGGCSLEVDYARMLENF